MCAHMRDDLGIRVHIFDKKNIQVLFDDTTLSFLTVNCRLTRRNCSVFVSVCVYASVCQKFESVCRLLTSPSGLKLLYSSGKFLLCEK